MQDTIGLFAHPEATDILLCTLGSSFSHTAIGLRYLFANQNELQSRTKILEFTIAQNSRDIVEKLLAFQPKIIGFGVYIWNANETLILVSLLKKVAPQIKIVLGGPEVSFEASTQEICKLADFTIQGEADLAFYSLCKDLLNNETPHERIVPAILPDIGKIKSPYSYYTDHDIKNRIIYVEASRGCPFKCEYCLSSLDKSVRNFEISNFLLDIQNLIDRGARSFKFIDRTFNLSVTISTQILRFFLERIELGLFLHFEMVPDRLPLEIKDLIEKFPAGSLQFEIGIQTLNPQVAINVSRKNDLQKVAENFQFLKEKTHVHTHADLIVGLPGENLDSFGLGFDHLLAWSPDEIQVGILKRLKGTPIVRHDQVFKMNYQDQQPFQILSTKDLSYEELQRMNRFAKFWDLIANSGNFPNTLGFMKQEWQNKSLFKEFLHLSDYLHTRHPQGFGVSPVALLESLWCYLSKIEVTLTNQVITEDYYLMGKRGVPNFFPENQKTKENIKNQSVFATPKRQRKHLLD